MIKKYIYPLLSNAFSKSDINCGMKVLKSRHITMSKITKNFEKQFSKKIGCKYALMTNSGSSANLTMMSALKKFYDWKTNEGYRCASYLYIGL